MDEPILPIGGSRPILPMHSRAASDPFKRSARHSAALPAAIAAKAAVATIATIAAAQPTLPTAIAAAARLRHAPSTNRQCGMHRRERALRDARLPP